MWHETCLHLHRRHIGIGESESEHLHNLDQVLAKLEAAGLRLKRAKYAFMLPSVDYMGHTIMSEGLQLTKEKVCAIVEALAPQNASQLCSFLGFVNYYNKFFPLQHISTTLQAVGKVTELVLGH